MTLCASSKPTRSLLTLNINARLCVTVLLLVSLIATFSPSAEAQQVVEIGSGSVDHDKYDSNRWVRVNFDPLTSGTHTINVTADGNASIRFSVFQAPSATNTDEAERIATTNRSTPMSWTGYLDNSKHYYLGVWAESGSGNFTATISAETAEPDPLQSFAGNEQESLLEPSESWQLRGTANTVLVVGNNLFIGGNFTQMYNETGGSLKRAYLAAVDRVTGVPTDFAPDLDDEVWALAVSPDNKTLYVGGSFLKAEGQERVSVAAYDIESGSLKSFATPPPNGALRAIAVGEDKVFLGGLFTEVGNEDRTHLAAFDPTTGELDDDFEVRLDERVKTLAMGVDRLWIGGDFTRVNGVSQKNIGAVDPVDGSRQATDDVDYPVIALALSNTKLFIAGGGPGGKAAAFNRATGVEEWEITSDGNFQAVDVAAGNYVYFGGHYESIEGDDRIDRLTRHDKETGQTDVSWLPRINGIRSINAVDVTVNGLHIGGDFTRVEGDSHEGIAIYPGETD